MGDLSESQTRALEKLLKAVPHGVVGAEDAAESGAMMALVHQGLALRREDGRFAIRLAGAKLLVARKKQTAALAAKVRAEQGAETANLIASVNEAAAEAHLRPLKLPVCVATLRAAAANVEAFLAHPDDAEARQGAVAAVAAIEGIAYNLDDETEF